MKSVMKGSSEQIVAYPQWALSSAHYSMGLQSLGPGTGLWRIQTPPSTTLWLDVLLEPPLAGLVVLYGKHSSFYCLENCCGTLLINYVHGKKNLWMVQLYQTGTNALN